MNERRAVTQFPTRDLPPCPSCGATNVRTDYQVQKFLYGNGESAVELQALVPIRTCIECNFGFTDYEAEDARLAAVCRHLGVMTPPEIVKLRKAHSLSRKAFAEVTCIGIASIARWETGQVIQNQAYDRYLYLLRWKENLHRLEQRNASGDLASSRSTPEDLSANRFRHLSDPNLAARDASGFSLRAAM